MTTPWRSDEPRRLVDVLDDHRAPGFDAFREIVEFTNKADKLALLDLSEHERRFLRIFEIMGVAAVEAAYREETVHDATADMAAVYVVSACANAAAMLAVQAYSEEGLRGPVKRELARMLMRDFKRGIDYFRDHVGAADAET